MEKSICSAEHTTSSACSTSADSIPSLQYCKNSVSMWISTSWNLQAISNAEIANRLPQLICPGWPDDAASWEIFRVMRSKWSSIATARCTVLSHLQNSLDARSIQTTACSRVGPSCDSSDIGDACGSSAAGAGSSPSRGGSRAGREVHSRGRRARCATSIPFHTSQTLNRSKEPPSASIDKEDRTELMEGGESNGTARCCLGGEGLKASSAMNGWRSASTAEIRFSGSNVRIRCRKSSAMGHWHSSAVAGSVRRSFGRMLGNRWLKWPSWSTPSHSACFPGPGVPSTSKILKSCPMSESPTNMMDPEHISRKTHASAHMSMAVE
mmetsp:Transcript_15131/g.37853  ORF Transcript_15131/g.37853 Transcript_15131/m.37853 type:complete len:324 (+) Transcript_15131:1279-2250(+)